MREIPGFNGRYAVTPDGRVWSNWSEKWLKLGIGNTGYYVVNLYKPIPGRHPQRTLVHRVLAETYLKNPNNYPFVLHENDEKLDNRLENLRWGTPSENHFDRVKNGIHWQAKKTHCKWGHPFSGENLKVVKEGGRRVRRRCRQCVKDSWQRRKLRMRKSVQND